MNNIKKDFVSIVELLKNNENKKVSTILEQVLALCEKKSQGGSNGSTLFKDSEGKVLAVYCYYHKKWEVVTECEYGSKANTSSGLNTMCKEGVSNWTKQQRQSKTKQSEVLLDVSKGLVEPSLVKDLLEGIDIHRNLIVPRSDSKGFDTVEEIEQYLNQ